MTTIEFENRNPAGATGPRRTARHTRRTRAARDFDRHRMWVVARTDLRQLVQSKDYWIPMVALGSLFFFVIPTILLLTITRIGDINVVQQASQALRRRTTAHLLQTAHPVRDDAPHRNDGDRTARSRRRTGRGLKAERRWRRSGAHARAQLLLGELPAAHVEGEDGLDLLQLGLQNRPGRLRHVSCDVCVLHAATPSSRAISASPSA